MKRRLRLKKWVSLSIYLSLVIMVFVSLMFVNNIIDERYGDSLNMSYILKDYSDSDVPVIAEKTEEIIKPFNKDNINIEIDFYDKDSNEELQEKSLILYENTYMPNTGILYSSIEPFDILVTLDGKVTKISKDELLGNVVEITHSNNLITTYYSIDNVNLTEGQVVKQGDVIGTSGKNNISSTSDNMLLFEVSLNGININPEVYFQMKLEDLN